MGLGVCHVAVTGSPWPLGKRCPGILRCSGATEHGLFSASLAATKHGCKGRSAKGHSRSAVTSSDGPLLPAGNSRVHSAPAGGRGPRYPLGAPKEPSLPVFGV